MKYTIGIILLITGSLSAVDWNLVWEENFNGTQIDTSVWKYEIGYIRNNELQYYSNRPENARVENGNLVIEARKDNWDGNEYTSASLNTFGTKSWKYGRIEMRAKLVKGKGMWPAFWAMGESGRWPARGELDIMEMIGGPGKDNVTHGTVHWDDDGHKSNGGTLTLDSGVLADSFRVYGVEWDSLRIRWYLDSTYFHTVDITSPAMREFHQRFWLLVNLAVGGNWPGDPDSNTVFPQQYLIDWIRVYQPEGYVDSRDANLILNPEFDIDTDFWGSSFSGGAAGSLVVVQDAGMSGDNALRVDIDNAGTANWHIQVSHTVPMRKGDTLDISFLAKAAAEKNMAVIIQEPWSPYVEYFHQNFTATAGVQAFGPYRYICTETDMGAQLKFLAAGNTATVWLDSVQVVVRPADPGGTVVRDDVRLPDNKNRVWVYPQPVTDQAGFKVPVEPGGHILEIYDQAGNMIWNHVETHGRASLRWSGSDIAGNCADPGIYYYHIKSRGSVYRGSFLKIR